jgi:5-methylthioadenosine/S-adenosylhomocysteine deaminase
MRRRRSLWIVLLLLAVVPAARGAGREKADRIVIAAHVVTMDAALHIYEPGAVAIRGGRVAAVGPEAAIRAAWTARDTYRAGERWVMPGLVNTHNHIAMCLMRGLADDMELMTWLRRYIFPLEAKVVNAGYVYEASLVGCSELIRRGVPAVVDMYYFEDEVARAVREAGLRGWLGQTLIDFKAPDFATPDEALAYTEGCLRKWAADPLVKVIPSPHSTYTCSPETLRKAVALARKHGVLLTTHLAESDSEMADVQAKYGRTPVAQAAAVGMLGRDILAAHCVHLSPADLDLLQQTGTAVAHNPDSNLKLASGLAPVVEMRRRGIPVGLGTDGPVSNNRMDLFHAMDLAAKIHKVREHDATVMPALDVVRMATIEGARAVGAADAIGSLEPGKQADLIVVDLQGPAYGPVYNIYSSLVYVADGEVVESTMVAGRWLMKERKLLSLDERRMQRILDTYRGRVIRAVEEQP